MGVSQAELAGAMSMQPSQVSQAERGRTSISAKFIDRYRKAVERCRVALRIADEHLEEARRLHDAEGRTPREVPVKHIIARGT